MKNKRIFVRSIAIATIVVALIACGVMFAACNKSTTKSITDIFKSRSSYGELTEAKLEFRLPAGWKVYTNSTTSSTTTNVSQYSDVGYIEEIDAFVVCVDQSGNNKLSIVKCGDKSVYRSDLMEGMMFGPDQGIRAIRYKAGLFVCLFDDGTAGAFDAASGREVISRKKLGYGDNPQNKAYGFDDTNGKNIDSVIKILCGGLIAVNYNYDHQSEKDFTSIYRPTYEGNRDDRGELVCRIQNSSNSLDQVAGFDGKYASVSGTSNGEYMYKIPDHAPNNGPQSLIATSRGSVTTNSKTGYTDEITYIGNGKFFVCQDWESSKDDYTYYTGEKYIQCVRGVYNAEKDKYDEYNSNTVFNNLTNNYYGASKPGVSAQGVDTRSYLKDGYTYVSFGLTIYESNGVKYGLYDQFILDGNLNIVMSLTGNYGITIKDQTKDKVGFFDLIMCGVDGVYYVPYQPSAVNLYDKDGNLVGHNDRSTILRQEFNSYIMVAQVPDPDRSSSYYYGAYNRYGDLLIPFEYDMLASYRGNYTIGRRYGRADVEGESQATRKLCLIGPDGRELSEAECYIDSALNVEMKEPFWDIAYSSTSTSIVNAIYKTGCYMFKVDSGEKDNGKIIYNYGIRNFNPYLKDSVIIEPHMKAGSILYSPTDAPSNVFVFEKLTGDSTAAETYVIYRLV